MPRVGRLLRRLTQSEGISSSSSSSNVNNNNNSGSKGEKVSSQKQNVLDNDSESRGDADSDDGRNGDETEIVAGVGKPEKKISTSTLATATTTAHADNSMKTRKLTNKSLPPPSKKANSKRVRQVSKKLSKSVSTVSSTNSIAYSNNKNKEGKVRSPSASSSSVPTARKASSKASPSRSKLALKKQRSQRRVAKKESTATADLLDALYDSGELDAEEQGIPSDHEGSDGSSDLSDDYSEGFVGSFEDPDNRSESQDFECLSPIEIAKEQNREITMVAETLSVSRDDATALLKHFQWKRERLLTCYFEDPEAARHAAGVAETPRSLSMHSYDGDSKSDDNTSSTNHNSNKRDCESDSDAVTDSDSGFEPSIIRQRHVGGSKAEGPIAGAGRSAQSPDGIPGPSFTSAGDRVSGAVQLHGDEECTICGDEMPAEECTALVCRHRFCNDCWGTYLSLKIRDGETILHCPGDGCRIACDEATISALVPSEDFDRYLEFVTRSFVDDSGASVKWCPAPNCGNAITSDLVSGQVVRCSCGYRFCFSCHKEAHAPASCSQVTEWDKKCADDSETDHWKIANTKECPKNGCSVSTEKNGGCNHMTCRQCKHEWCWVCMRPWKGHNDYYNCNKYTKDEKRSAPGGGGGGGSTTSRLGLSLLFDRKSKALRRAEREAERERTRQALERYLHFFKRYANHSHSRDLEQQIRERASGKLAELSNAATTNSEVQYVVDGTNCLLECRNVLKYTYVFAFYLPDHGPEKELFEYLQEDLEKTTESLSEVLEHADLTQVNRLRAVNTIQLARTRMTNLLRGVEEGLTGQADH